MLFVREILHTYLGAQLVRGGGRSPVPFFENRKIEL